MIRRLQKAAVALGPILIVVAGFGVIVFLVNTRAKANKKRRLSVFRRFKP